VVFRDETWSCEVALGYEVPGWYIFRLRRHAEGWAALALTELAEFGERCQRLSSAMQRAPGVNHVYFMQFGENYPHFHFLVAARGVDLPPELRGGNILSLRESHRDTVDAIAPVPGLRAVLAADPTHERTGPIPAAS
jgi:diadenosine tetraphosphate (Ap4A) HIT family hydrolase